MNILFVIVIMIMFLSVLHDYILPHFTKRVYCSGSTIPQENTSLIAKTYLTRFSNDMALWPVLICCGITVMYYILKRIHSKYHCWGNIKISISHCEHLMKGKCICLSHKWTFIAVSTIICFILKWNGCMYKYTIKRQTSSRYFIREQTSYVLAMIKYNQIIWQ
jgi:hypothetical protein